MRSRIGMVALEIEALLFAIEMMLVEDRTIAA
jgi:hypothetical protein